MLSYSQIDYRINFLNFRRVSALIFLLFFFSILFLGWTAVTMDGSRSAQFEHTMLVTENGCDLLTARIGQPTDRIIWDLETFKR